MHRADGRDRLTCGGDRVVQLRLNERGIPHLGFDGLKRYQSRAASFERDFKVGEGWLDVIPGLRHPRQSWTGTMVSC